MNLSITMDVTNRCNSRCKTCYFSLPGFKPKGKDMTFDEFRVIVGKLSDHSGRLALSCEFEPLLHVDIEDILRECAPLAGSWQIRLNTNGILLSEAVSRALVDSRIAEIYVSLDAPTSELNGEIRGNTKFDHIVREVKRLNRIKADREVAQPVCILRSTAMQANLHELPGMISLCSEVGAERFSVKHLIPIAECEWEGRPIAEQSCLLCPDQTSAVFELIRAQGKKRGVVVDLPPAAPKPPEDLRVQCGYMNNGFHIFPDGVCYPCVWLTHNEPYGNLIQDSLDAVLDSPIRKKTTEAFHPPHTPEGCINCLRDSQTVGIKAYNDARERLSDGPSSKG